MSETTFFYHFPYGNGACVIRYQAKKCVNKEIDGMMQGKRLSVKQYLKTERTIEGIMNTFIKSRQVRHWDYYGNQFPCGIFKYGGIAFGFTLIEANEHQLKLYFNQKDAENLFIPFHENFYSDKVHANDFDKKTAKAFLEEKLGKKKLQLVSRSMFDEIFKAFAEYLGITAWEERELFHEMKHPIPTLHTYDLK